MKKAKIFDNQLYFLITSDANNCNICMDGKPKKLRETRVPMEIKFVLLCLSLKKSQKIDQFVYSEIDN